MRVPIAACFRAVMSAAFVCACVMLFSSCSSVRVHSAPGFDFAKLESYAWADPPEVRAARVSEDDEFIESQAKRVIQRELQGMGLTQVDRAEAPMLVAATLGVEVKLQDNDPNFDLYVAEKYEVGTVRIEFFDPSTEELLWSGERQLRLRYVSRTYGGMAPKFEPTGQVRNWHLEEMVEKVLAQLK